MLRLHHFTTREQVRRITAGWVNECNADRGHSTDGMLSPIAYERAQATDGGLEG